MAEVLTGEASGVAKGLLQRCGDYKPPDKSNTIAVQFVRQPSTRLSCIYGRADNSTGPVRVHHGGIDHSDQCHLARPMGKLLLQNRRHEECFASSVIYLSLSGSLVWDQCAAGGSYFTDGPAGMKEEENGRERWDDDMALQGSWEVRLENR